MNLSNALLKHEQIKTTLPKAKELKPFVEKKIIFTRVRKLICILEEKQTHFYMMKII